MPSEKQQSDYRRLAHAMQSGVAFALQHGSPEATPKHLRVGINSSMVEHGALVSLLVEKGLITEEEFFDKLIHFMGLEVESYKRKIKEQLGMDVDLELL